MDLGHWYLRHVLPAGPARRFGLLLAGSAVVLVAAAALLVSWQGSALHSASRTPAFIAHQLGAPSAVLPAVSRPRYRARSEVTPGGFQVRLGGASVSLSSADGGHGRWTSYAGGAARPTHTGQELVTVSGSGAEQLLQVDRHQGVHTWRWELDTSGLTTSLRKDGTVAFLGAGGKDTGVRIAPVELFDTNGASVTPRGLHWSLARRGGGQFLELRLDDASLPVPYLIDPAVTVNSFAGSSMVAGATANWTVQFTTSVSGSLSAGNTITVTFPNVAGHLNFTVPATPAIALGAGFTFCSATATGAATTVTITLANSGGACTVGNSTAATLTINGLQNPTRAVSTINKSTFTVLTSKDTVANWGLGTVAFVVGPAVKLLMFLPAEAADPGSLTNGKTGTPTKMAANTATTTINLRAVDQYWNTVTTVTDTLALTSSDPLATFTNQTPTLVLGQWAAGTATLKTPLPAGQTLTVTDTTDATKTASTSAPIPVYAANGSGTMTVDKPNVSAGASSTLVFTYTAATGGTSGGTLRLLAPAGWTLPAGGNTTVAFSGTATGTLGFGAAQRIDVTALTMSAGETVTITYGPVTVPAVGTLPTWTTTETSVTGGTITALAASPTATVNAANGSGTMTVAPTLVTAGSTTNTHTFTYTAAAGGMSNGTVKVAVPAGWTAPNTTSGTAGYTVASTGAVATAGSNITVTGVTLAAAATMTITYGSGGGGAVTAPTLVGTSTFTTSQNSTASSPLVAIGASPSVTVAAGAASVFSLTGTPASLAAGGTGSVTVTAQDGYGNTATSFTGTVAFTSNDPAASLPSNYTFTGGDAGVHTFTNLYTLKTTGWRTITATSGGVTGTSGGITVNPGSAASLAASAPASTTAGAGLVATVTASDSYGNIATGYTGTVSFTSTDAQAVLPAAYPFVGADNGSKAFAVTLKTASSQTVSVSDGAFNATSGSISVSPGVASTYTVGAPGTATAGSAVSVTVTAKDAYGNTATGYTGTVSLTSNDPQAVLPAPYAYGGGDAGAHTFSVTLKTAGSKTVSASDGSINATSGSIAVSHGPLAMLAVSAPASATAGSAVSVTVSGADAYGNVTTGYTGTVTLTSSDGQAVLPGPYAFTGADAGIHVFSVTLKTAGSRTVSASDGSINGTSGSITVNPAAAASLTISGTPASATAGTGFSLTVTARDAYDNVATAYTGSVSFTSTDAQAALPAGYSFAGADAGVQSFSATLKTAGSQTVSVSDGSLNATSGAVSVGPAAASTFDVSAPGTATAGTPVSVTVTAKDPYNNVATGYTGTVSFTSTDAQAALSGGSFAGADAGVHTFSATLKTAGSQTVSASDGPISGTSGSVAVGPGPVGTSASTVTGAPASVVADGSTAVAVTVTLKDAYGNVVPGKNVSLAATGAAAVSPASVATDGSGVAAFNVTDTAVESSTFTATDTSDSVTVTQTASASFVAGPLWVLSISPSSSSVAAGVSQAYSVTGADAYGHSLGAQTATFSIAPDGSCVDASSSCSATQPGNHAVTATVGSKQAFASLGVAAGPTSAATTAIGASPSSIVADGAASSAITVTAKDAYGNARLAGGDVVTLSATDGTLSAVVDNGNGTYSATLTASLTPGPVTVSGTINAAPIAATSSVTFTNSDVTPPSLLSATASGGTLTLSYDEALDTGSVAAPGDFAVVQNLGPDGVTSVLVSGSMVVLSLGSPVSSGDLVTISYSGTATKDLAGNSAAGLLNQTVTIAAPPPAATTSCPRPLILDAGGNHCVAPPPPPPPIKFLGSSPADGAALTGVDAITLTANHMSSWYAISVARPDGGTTELTSGSGASFSQPFAATAAGVYTLTATMDDGFNPAQRITAHFTIVPTRPDVALPGKAGSVEAADGGITVNWTARTFTEPVQVNIDGGGAVRSSFGLGSRVVRVTVVRLADGTTLQAFAEPLELVFNAAGDGVPSVSEDGVNWTPLPALSSNALPVGQADGYFRDASGAVHVLTRHLTFFGILGAQGPAAAKLALTVTGTAVGRAGSARRIAVSVHITKPATIRASLRSAAGKLIEVWTRSVPAGASTLNLTLPAGEVYRGACTIVLRATAGGQVTLRTVAVRLR